MLTVRSAPDHGTPVSRTVSTTIPCPAVTALLMYLRRAPYAARRVVLPSTLTDGSRSQVRLQARWSAGHQVLASFTAAAFDALLLLAGS